MSVRHSAIKGAGYASIAAFAGRGSSFISQLILGWILAENDFAVFAIAIAVMGFTNALSHGGADIYMLQASDRIHRVLPAGMKLATIFDIGIPLIIAVLAWPIANAFQIDDQSTHDIAYVLWIIAASFPLRLFGLSYRMRAAAELRFGEVSFADFAQNFTQQALIVIFALCGFGVFSFVLGQPIVNLLDWYILRKRIGPPSEISGPLVTLRSIIKPAGLILVTALGISLMVGTTENLILGELAPAILAYYFFAYRITGSIGRVFATGIRTVLVPSLAKIKSEPQRMQAAGIKACQMSFFVTVPIFYICALMIGPVMHFLWQGKWDNAAIVAFALLLEHPYRLILFINRSFLEANGKWATTAILVWVDGILFAITLILVTMQTQNLITIICTIAIYRGAVGLFLSLLALNLGGIHIKRLIPLLAVPLVSALAMLPTWYFSSSSLGGNISVVHSITSIGIFTASYILLGACFLRPQFKQTISTINLRRKH